MTTTLYLVRHGQTDWNLAHRWQGHIDIPLNETGRRQAQLLSARLASHPIQAIYTSDLVRASETATIMARPLGLTPLLEPALRERSGGQFQGLTFAELESQYPDAWRKVRFKNGTPPGGESHLEVAQRIIAAYESITREHEGQLVALVSHGGALNLLIAYILGFSPGQPAQISLRGNTGLSIVEVEKAGGRLVSLNDIAHLQSESDPRLAHSLPSPAEAS